MLNLSCTLMHQTREIPCVPGFQVREEGLPLVAMLIDGKEAVKPYEGGADAAITRFVGFSYSETLTPLSATLPGKYTTDADGAVLLPYEPMTGQLSVWVYTGTGAGKKRLAASDITIDPSNPRRVVLSSSGTPHANKVADIVFRYLPTLQTAFFEHRVLIPSMSASAMTGSTGVIISGEVHTDKYDLSCDFSDVNGKLYLGANGLIGMCAASASTPSGAMDLKGLTVTALPSATNGFLGLRVNVA